MYVVPDNQLSAISHQYDAHFLAGVKQHGRLVNGEWLIPDRDWDELTRPHGLGDTVERLVKPIAVAFKLNCLDEYQRLKPDSGCAKRREKLNRLGRRLSL